MQEAPKSYKNEEMYSPQESPKGTHPADTLILGPGDSFQTSDLQNWKTIYLGRFQPLRVW